MNNWQPIKTAPKNSIIIVKSDYPWSLPAIWCEASNDWIVYTLQTDVTKESYLECDGGGKPTHWQEMPKGL